MGIRVTKVELSQGEANTVNFSLHGSVAGLRFDPQAVLEAAFGNTVLLVSRDTTPEEPAPGNDEAPTDTASDNEPASSAGAGGRRRRGRGAASTAESASAGEEAGGAEEGKPAPSARRRGSRAGTPAPTGGEEAGGAEEGNGGSPSGTAGRARRGRSTSKEDASNATPEASATGRRRRGGKASVEAPAGTEEIEVTHTDVTKAAAEAAQKILPTGVRKVMADFEVSDLRELDTNDKRRNFIVKLEDAVNEAA